jgi:hypothetical protein
MFWQVLKLAPYYRVFLQKLMVIQMISKIHMKLKILSEPIQSNSHPISVSPASVFFHLCVGHCKISSIGCLPATVLYYFSFASHICLIVDDFQSP